MFRKICPNFQFGDLIWVRRTDSAARYLAWARRFNLAPAWFGDLNEFAVYIRRFAVLNLSRRLHFLLLHFGAQHWFAVWFRRFAVWFRRFAVSHHVRLFSACLQSWGSVKNGAEGRLRRFAVLVRRTPFALRRPWLNFGHFSSLLWSFCTDFASFAFQGLFINNSPAKQHFNIKSSIIKALRTISRQF